MDCRLVDFGQRWLISARWLSPSHIKCRRARIQVTFAGCLASNRPGQEITTVVPHTIPIPQLYFYMQYDVNT